MESVGDLHRVYVDGVLRLEARDRTHEAGRYGLRTYSAAAAYDDVTAVSP
jgi:hypothetical protein